MEFGQEVSTFKNIHCWQQRIVVPFYSIGLLSKSKYSENGEWGTSTEYYGFRGTRLFVSSCLVKNTAVFITTEVLI